MLGKKVSMKDVIKWNPDVIITTTNDAKGRYLKIHREYIYGL